ncbi:MAG: hypothetical protein ABW022_07285 [Actinoplanes sp.]
MRLPEGFSFSYPTHDTNIWCIRQGDARRLLCGQRLGFAAEVTQPDDPQQVHDRCVEALGVLLDPPQIDQPPTGVCPACEAVVGLAGRRIGPHGDGCAGVNLPPKKRGRR